MAQQPELLFEDPESITRRDVLNVVHAEAKSVGSFSPSYFSGFDTFRALTYTSSIPMVAGLLRDHDFRDFECVFGHSGILSRDVRARDKPVRGEHNPSQRLRIT